MGIGQYVSSPVLFFLVPFLALSFSISFAEAEVALYEEHAFSIEYPADWEIVDTWQAQPREIFFKSDFKGETGVSVFYQKSLIPLSYIDDALVDTLAENEKERCRLNRDGDCWSFVLLDAKIITIGAQKAISLKYSSFLKDKDTITRMVLLPDGQYNWLILGKSAGNGLVWEDDIEKSVSSFKLDSGSIMIEPQELSTFTPSFSAPIDSNIILEKNLQVNLILVGDTWSTPEKNSITSELPGYFDPTYVTNEEKVGIRYNYQYNFISEDSSDLSSFMDTISYPNSIRGDDPKYLPYWQAYWIFTNHPEWIDFDVYGNAIEYNIEYRDVDALAMEEYLYEHFVGSNPALTKPNSVNLVFLKTDLEDIDYLHNYFVTDLDKSTAKEHNYYGLMGYGGNYNMFFFDLYAAPWIDIDRVSFEYIFPSWIESLHDCGTEQCFRELVTYHTNSAISQIITPSFLYPIEYYENYLVDVVVYDIPGGPNLTPLQLTKYINEDLIIKEFEDLFPFAKWEIQTSIENRETRGVSIDFKDELKGKNHIVYNADFGEERTVSYLHSSRIQPHLLDWADLRGQEMLIDKQVTWQIPVLIVIDDSTARDLYLDDFGVIGFAPGKSYDESVPCCAFGVTNEKNVKLQGIGITDLVLHEVGHVIGLNHPFFYWDEFGDIYQNNYFNWYASPMTYSSPPSRCGTIFYFVFSDPCGNANLSFTEFEKERMSDARLVSLLKNSANNLKFIPEYQMSEIQDKINTAKQKYKAGDIYSIKGALPSAIDAYSSSQNIVNEPPTDTPVSSFLNSEKPLIPDWVQTTARFWVDGDVSDTEFTNGLGYLVKQKIIQVEVEPESGDSQSEAEESEVPAWIAQTTEWWIDGEVPEDQFLEGIKWMIENNIIRGIQ